MIHTFSNLNVLVTGANGFIGKNLVSRLAEMPNITVLPFYKHDSFLTLEASVHSADIVVHLAGVNRPTNELDFHNVNVQFTHTLCDLIKDVYFKSSRHIPVLFASSSQAPLDNSYGRSKLNAEHLLKALYESSGNPSIIFRLPGVFGKWCQPNYNSVVATFCHNVARNLPIQVDDPAREITLVYIDDVVSSLIDLMTSQISGFTTHSVHPEYRTSLGSLADLIYSFSDSRCNLTTERVGHGFKRALYSTYLSYLPTEQFSYDLKKYSDQRGHFVEVLKTPDSGQFSFFTAFPGSTRGGHYHHTKTEKIYCYPRLCDLSL